MTEDLWEMEVGQWEDIFHGPSGKTCFIFLRSPEPKIEATIWRINLQQDYKASCSNA